MASSFKKTLATVAGEQKKLMTSPGHTINFILIYQSTYFHTLFRNKPYLRAITAKRAKYYQAVFKSKPTEEF